MNKSLLPPSSTVLERAAANALAEIERVPVPLRDLWNPDTCPEHLLPYLAWAFSVDRWDERWPEDAKRQVVRNSFFVHQRKGTIAALRRVVEPLGYLLRVEEWWQTEPLGERGTFRLDIGVLDHGITEQTFEELERLIDDAQPLARHMIGLAIKLEVRGAFHVAAASYSGDDLTVYPFEPGPINVGGLMHTGIGEQIIDTMSVNYG